MVNPVPHTFKLKVIDADRLTKGLSVTEEIFVTETAFESKRKAAEILLHNHFPFASYPNSRIAYALDFSVNGEIQWAELYMQGVVMNDTFLKEHEKCNIYEL